MRYSRSRWKLEKALESSAQQGLGLAELKAGSGLQARNAAFRLQGGDWWSIHCTCMRLQRDGQITYSDSSVQWSSGSRCTVYIS